MFILDTDICIYLLNGKAPGIVSKLRDLPKRLVVTSAITAAELHYGALHSVRSEKNLKRVQAFLAPLQIIPFGDEAAEHFGRIKQALTTEGTPIGPMDLLIAATAVSVGAALVTNNRGEFKRVQSLKLADWPIP